VPVGGTVTLDELKAQLAADCPFWGEREWGAFLSAAPEEQQAIATAMHLSGQGPGVDGWKIALTILQDAAPAFSAIPTVGPFITGGIEAVLAILGLFGV
jgi:hypothetical protein